MIKMVYDDTQNPTSPASNIGSGVPQSTEPAAQTPQYPSQASQTQVMTDEPTAPEVPVTGSATTPEPTQPVEPQPTANMGGSMQEPTMPSQSSDEDTNTGGTGSQA